MKLSTYHIITVLVLLLSHKIVAQELTIPAKINDSAAIYLYTDDIPVFTDGSFENFIVNNYQFTDEMYYKGMPGTLVVAFEIDKNGNVSDIRVMPNRGLSDIQNNEALRVIQLTSGKWIPAKINGQPVRTIIQQKFTFDEVEFSAEALRAYRKQQRK